MIKNIKKCENIKETETYDCKCEFYWKQFLKFEYSNKWKSRRRRTRKVKKRRA